MPDIFLVSFDLPVVALVFVPYFVVLHAAEGVRLALAAYAAEFEARAAAAQRDEAAMGETVRRHQALELLLEHASLVLEPALRWMLLFGCGAMLATLTWAGVEFSVGDAHRSLGLFALSLLLGLAMLPMLRATEQINGFQPRLEKLAFSVGDPASLGSALPASISQAAMLREYVREHALQLPVGGVLIRPGSVFSSSSLLSLFGLLSVPYFVLVLPLLFGDPHFNRFKARRTHRPARAALLPPGAAHVARPSPVARPLRSATLRSAWCTRTRTTAPSRSASTAGTAPTTAGATAATSRSRASRTAARPASAAGSPTPPRSSPRARTCSCGAEARRAAERLRHAAARAAVRTRTCGTGGPLFVRRQPRALRRPASRTKGREEH